MEDSEAALMEMLSDIALERAILKASPLPLPPGLAVPAANIAEKAGWMLNWAAADNTLVQKLFNDIGIKPE